MKQLTTAEFLSLKVEELSDPEVLALSRMHLSDEEQEVFSDLLYKNRERLITEDERKQLAELVELYELALLQKAEALRVAVERGLREPLSF